MNELMVFGLYLILCAGVDYALFVAFREFVSGFKAAGAELGIFRKASFGSSNDGGDSQTREGNANSASQEKNARSSRPWHDVLGTSPSATLEEIKTAYRQRISLYHPDKVAGLGEELRQLAETHAKEINAAYATACRLREASR